MRLNFQFQRYNSKLATIVSLLQSGIVGLIFLFPVCCIPAFICLACNVSGAIVGALFGVGGVLSIVTYILFCKFVKPDKIEERTLNKKNSILPPDIESQSYQSEEERIQELAFRSYIGSLSEDEFEKLEFRKENGKYTFRRKDESEGDKK